MPLLCRKFSRVVHGVPHTNYTRGDAEHGSDVVGSNSCDVHKLAERTNSSIQIQILTVTLVCVVESHMFLAVTVVENVRRRQLQFVLLKSKNRREAERSLMQDAGTQINFQYSVSWFQRN